MMARMANIPSRAPTPEEIPKKITLRVSAVFAHIEQLRYHEKLLW